MDLDNGYDHTPSFSHRRNTSNFNNKILVTAIISLSVVVVLVTILHIYARYVLRRQARRRAALRHLSFMAAIEAQSGRNHPKGLHPTILASLPVLVFRHMDGEDGSNLKDCAVCLSGLEDGELVRMLPNCKHNFHVECIDKWLDSHSTCPVCRNEAEPKLVRPEPREPMIMVPTPSAPSMETVSHAITGIEVGTSDGTTTIQASAKVTRQSSSRLSSFRRMLSRDRSSRQIPVCTQEVGAIDLERQ